MAALLVPAIAQGQPIIDVTPTIVGSSAAVGDTAQGQLTIANHSTPNHDQGFLTLSELTLVPSCGAQFADQSCAFTPPGADPGVITIGPTATGSGACNGNIFTVATADALTGKRTFTPSSAVQLSASGATSTCVVTFSYTVEHAATKDSDNNPANGMQTDLVAFVKATASFDNAQTADPGWNTVTITKDTPELTARASPAVQTGGQLTVAGTIDGTHPDGSITFDLYGPGDAGCSSAPMFTSTVGVNGNGTYQSQAYVATLAGTHRWKVSYGGDDDNRAVATACNEPAAATVVSAPPPPPPPPPVTPPPPPPVTPPPPPPPTPPGGGGTTPGGGTVPGGGGTGEAGKGTIPGAGVQKIRLDAFALSRKSFARASKVTALAATAAKATTKKKVKKAAKGTTIKYTLSAPATVTIVVERVSKGRRSGTKCVKATTKLKKKKSCTLYTKASTIKRTHRTGGAKKVPFSGRAGRKSLASGDYRMRATAAAGVGTTSATRTAKFKIVKR